MYENKLTRRQFLLITASGTLIPFLDSCGGASIEPANSSTPSPQSSSNLSLILPSTITPAGFGVNIHFIKPEGKTKMISNAGFGFVRMDFPWSDIERRKGEYNFSTQKTLVNALADQGIFALAILAYGNPLYDNSPAPFHVGPHTNEMRQAFARFAAACVSEFKEQKGMIWEIWNEPNNPDFWQPNPNVDDYIELAEGTIEAMRQANKNVNIIAPAITTYPQNLDFWNFLERCFARGLLKQIDAVSIHPYRYNKLPETAADDYQRLRQLVTRYAPNERNYIPIISSEWGYPITDAVSEDFQAALLVRQFLINRKEGVPLSIWYDWQDDGHDPQNIQDTFGVLDWSNHPKSAYFGAQTLMIQLNGFQFKEHNSHASRGDYGLLFEKGKSQTLVVWTIGQSHHVSLSDLVQIPVDTSSIALFSMIGEKQILTPTNGVFTVVLTNSPQYLIVRT